MKSTLINILVVTKVLLWAFHGFSQSYNFKQYTVDDGIPGTEVFDVVQDDNGYIWFATNNGLCKFDGQEFKTVTIEDILLDNSIIQFYKAANGKIWFTTYKNQIGCIENDIIRPYKFNQIIDSLCSLYVNSGYVIKSFFFDENKNLNIGILYSGVYRINNTGFLNTRSEYLTNDSIRSLGFEKRKSLSIPQVYFFNDSNLVWTHSSLSPNMKVHINFSDKSFHIKPNTSKDKMTFRFYPDLWYDYIIEGTGNCLFFFKDTLQVYEKKTETDIINIRTDKNGYLWVCTYKDGIYCFSNPENLNEYKQLLEDKIVTSVINDYEGGYWFTTINNGVFYLPSLRFSSYTSKSGLKDNNISSVCFYDNKLWVATSNNFISYIIKDNIVHYELLNDNSNPICDLYNDKKEKLLWGGFKGHGNIPLFYFKHENIVKINTEKLMSLYPRMSNICFYSLYKDNSGDFWLSSDHNLHKLENERLVYRSQLDDNVEICSNAMSEGKNGNIWHGTRKGLWLFNNYNFTYFGDKNELFAKRIEKLEYSLQMDQLWIATKDNGIIIKAQDTIYTITKNNGLASNNVRTLFIDDNNVWVGTLNGLDKIQITGKDKFSYRIQHFSKNNGLVSNIINDIEKQNNTVYIATDKGITVFDKTKVPKNSFPPPTYITNILINRLDTLVNDFYELPYNKNFITIKFIGLTYKDPENRKYMYKMEGLDTAWYETNYNEIEFKTLPPGDYKFLVKTLNEDGFESEIPAEVSFTINPPFWITWWFYTIVVILIVLTAASVIVIFYRMKFMEYKKQNELKSELAKERQKALGQQMNPHFIFNTLNSIQYYIYNNDKISSNKYLSKFAKLMRTTLNNSQQETISIKDELDSLTLYLELEQLRFSNKFKYEILVDENIDQRFYRIPTLLIQPYIENSIKHGVAHLKENGLIKLELNMSNNTLFCTIEDNGIGRKRAEEINVQKRKTHKSYGTKITEKRLHLINSLYGKILTVKYTDLYENETVSGTKVKICIPLEV